MNNFATAQSCLRGHCFYAFGLFAAAASAALTVRMACIGKMDSELVESHEDTRLFNHLSSRDRIKRGNKYDTLEIYVRTCRLSGSAPKLQMNSTPHIESSSSDQVEGHEYAGGFTRLPGICEITHRLKHRLRQKWGFFRFQWTKGGQRTGSLLPCCSSTGDKTSRASVRSGLA